MQQIAQSIASIRTVVDHCMVIYQGEHEEVQDDTSASELHLCDRRIGAAGQHSVCFESSESTECSDEGTVHSAWRVKSFVSIVRCGTEDEV